MIMTNSVNVNLSLSAFVNCKLIGGGGYKSLCLDTKDIILLKIIEDYELTNRNIRFFS
ncbi:MAG: hypothetical protein ACI4VL_03380 [Bacilli bacterium]